MYFQQSYWAKQKKPVARLFSRFFSLFEMLQSASQWSPLVCLALAGLQPGALKQLVKSPPRATNRALHVCSCLMHIQLILDAALDNTYVVIISIILKQFYNIPVGNSAWWFFSSCSVSSLLSSCVYKRSVGRDTPFTPPPTDGARNLLSDMFEGQKQRNGLECQRQRDELSRPLPALRQRLPWMFRKPVPTYCRKSCVKAFSLSLSSWCGDTSTKED